MAQQSSTHARSSRSFSRLFSFPVAQPNADASSIRRPSRRIVVCRLQLQVRQAAVLPIVRRPAAVLPIVAEAAAKQANGSGSRSLVSNDNPEDLGDSGNAQQGQGPLMQENAISSHENLNEEN
ncbi:hypothetical protein EJB05_23081, partial [Eragrostis curvula]